MSFSGWQAENPRADIMPAVKHMDPVDPGQSVQLDNALLDRFPEGYRHLAYRQTQIGYKVGGKPRTGMKGPAVQSLDPHGKRWLASEPLAPEEA